MLKWHIICVIVLTLTTLFMKKAVIILIMATAIGGCIGSDPDYKFEYEIIITDTATNLQSLNSSYDDYNSNLPYPAARSEIYFSSNRNSGGEDYDIVCKAIDISFHEKDSILNFSIPENDSYSQYQTELLELVNTRYNELGPCSFGLNGWNYFFYANDESGKFDIKIVYTRSLDWATYGGLHVLNGPEDVTIANSAYDDLYPAPNKDMTRLFFCSDRENESFDIYSIALDTEELLHEYLSNPISAEVTKEPVLSSISNDKCPSINGNLMVFASDREGGYGGYDLYYSRFINGQWTTPENFGDKINSPADEYRPITFSFFSYSDLMIFSSNRPGGRGGFDLYCAKINGLTGE
jgi:hypothetical protein